jgi:Cu+-exporting ATPase
VATDGEVLEGASADDESMLTGESLPVEKAIGNRLYAGTLNQSGRLLARVSSVGGDTALAHIIAAVQRAQDSRANIQRLGDRVASVFVPIVVLVALTAACWWGLAPEKARQLHASLAPAWWHLHPPQGSLAGAVFVAAAVFIIACPCAMGLATPAAIMAGSNAAARRGILIRDGVALEKAGGVTAVLFDKTGTLTEGKPAVAATEFFEPAVDPNRRAALLDLASALARPSAHPLSQAMAKLQAGDVKLSSWTEVRGGGLEARVSTSGASTAVARLGSFRWLREQGSDLGVADAFAARWLESGATLLGLAIDNTLVAAFAIKDTLKPGARAVIDRLRQQGLRAFLVSGDNSVTARSVAAQAGIAAENVFAEVRPEEKAALVRRLQDEGERLAFVGDGINDAPALEQADLGIAVSRASDVARDAADIILLRSEIDAVPEALGLARATLRTIRQNLFWAFFYNAAAIPLAGLGFMSPVMCAATMGLSDIVVIGNALRLLRWKRE